MSVLAVYAARQLTAPRCTKMHLTAPRCNTLHHSYQTAAYCSTLQQQGASARHGSRQFAQYGNARQRTATHYTTLHTRHHTAPHLTTLHYTATNCNTLQLTATTGRLRPASAPAVRASAIAGLAAGNRVGGPGGSSAAVVNSAMQAHELEDQYVVNGQREW